MKILKYIQYPFKAAYQWFRKPVGKAGAMSLAGQAIGVSKKSGVAARVFDRTMWLGGVGLNGLFIWDIFSGWNDDAPQGVGAFGKDALSSTALDQAMESFVPVELAQIVAADINDIEAMAIALRQQGLCMLDDALDHLSAKGYAYIACAEYLRDSKGGILTNADDMRDRLSLEFASYYKKVHNQEDGWFDAEIATSEIVKGFEDVDFSEAPHEVVRRVDFYIYVLDCLISDTEKYVDEAEEEKARPESNPNMSNTVTLN